MQRKRRRSGGWMLALVVIALVWGWTAAGALLLLTGGRIFHGHEYVVNAYFFLVPIYGFVLTITSLLSTAVVPLLTDDRSGTRARRRTAMTFVLPAALALLWCGGTNWMSSSHKREAYLHALDRVAATSTRLDAIYARGIQQDLEYQSSGHRVVAGLLVLGALFTATAGTAVVLRNPRDPYAELDELDAPDSAG